MLTQGHGAPSAIVGGRASLSSVQGQPLCAASARGSSAKDGQRTTHIDSMDELTTTPNLPHTEGYSHSWRTELRSF